MSLIEEFNREMDLKSVTFLGKSTFGTKVMKEELMLLRHTVLSKKALQSL
jgi:hypothetical protein